MQTYTNKALFLDRDGVINHDPGDYTTNLEDFVILPYVLETLKKWYDAGYKLIVITNQGGLAKKLYTEHEVHAMHQYLQGECVFRGFEIEAFYYCSHHEAHNGKCLCRKPGSLMVERALHRFKINPELSLMIGDRDRDVACANGAGVRGIKIETNSKIPLPEEII